MKLDMDIHTASRIDVHPLRPSFETVCAYYSFPSLARESGNEFITIRLKAFVSKKKKKSPVLLYSTRPALKRERVVEASQ